MKQLNGLRVRASRRGLITLAIAAALIAAHVNATRRGADLVGALLVLDHLFNLALVAALLFVLIAVGRKVLKRLGLQNEPPLDTIVFSAGIGAGLVSTSILVLGLIGGLYPLALLALFALTAWIARVEVSELPSLLNSAIDQVRRAMAGPLPIAVLLLTALVTFFLVVLALTPPMDWDSLVLHLRVPAQFLAEHRVYVPEDNLPSGFLALVQFLYVPLLAANSESGPALLSAAITLLLGLALLALCLRFFDSEVALLCLAGLWGSGLVLMVAVTPRVDVTLAFYAVLTHYALLKTLRRSETTEEQGGAQHAFFFLAALLLGFTIAVKYQGLAYAAALTPLIIVAGWDLEGAARARIRNLVVFGAIVLLAVMPWVAKNLLLFEAPLYPMFAEPRVPAWIAELYGSQSVPAAGVKSAGVVWQLFEPFNLRDFFIAPQRISIEAESGFFFPTPLLVFLPLSLLLWRNRIARWLFVPGLLYVVLLIAYRPSTNVRYLIPGMVVLTIVVAAAVIILLRRGFPTLRERRLVILFLIIPLAFLPGAFTISFWFTQSAAVTHLVGAASPREYVLTRPGSAGLPEIIAAVRERLPQDARMLLLFEPRGYYFGGNAVQDSQMINWPLLALAPLELGCLEASGFTHILVNYGALAYRLDRGFEPDVFEWQLFPGFAERCLHLLYETRHFRLYQLRA